MDHKIPAVGFRIAWLFWYLQETELSLRSLESMIVGGSGHVCLVEPLIKRREDFQDPSEKRVGVGT